MNEHFIKNIEIRNFKCFNSFKVDGLKRVNLIGGKNNVGKTAFMEACYISTSKEVTDFYLKEIEFHTYRKSVNRSDGFTYREKEENLRQIINNFQPDILIQNFKDNLLRTNIVIYNNECIINLANREYRYNYNSLLEFLNRNISNTKEYYSEQFISTIIYPDFMLDRIISKVKMNHKYELLNEHLQKTFKIENIDILNGQPMVKKYIKKIDYGWDGFNGSFKPGANASPQPPERYYSLGEFGQGLRNYIYIICSLLISQDRLVFIDEIENGIHYSLLDNLWEMILTISEEQNVQVFATTHSKECIESYVRVAKELKNKDISLIELGKNDNNKIESIIYPYEWLIDEVEQNHEVRGW